MESNGHFRHRLIGNYNPENPSPQMEELSEQDIFNSPSGTIPPTPKPPTPKPKPTPQPGLLAALSETRPGSIPGSTTRPIFNHKTSTPPAASISIPRMLSNQERQVSFPQSAPIRVPVMEKAMGRNAREFDDVEEDWEEEEEEVVMPPHELVARREEPLFANSVLEGVGRTLKGRDLRQVRNAIWRKTGFLD